MTMAKAVTSAICLGIILSSCAKPPGEIEASYVSPITYQDYSCEQLAQEAARVSDRAAQISGVQQQKANSDAVKMGVGLILFWPTLFFIKGSGTTEAEIANLKGQMETIEQVSIQKNCGMEFQAAPPAEIAAEPEVIQAPVN